MALSLVLHGDRLPSQKDGPLDFWPWPNCKSSLQSAQHRELLLKQTEAPNAQKAFFSVFLVVPTILCSKELHLQGQYNLRLHSRIVIFVASCFKCYR